MNVRPFWTLAVIALFSLLPACSTRRFSETPGTVAQVIQRSLPGDWRTPDPEFTLYLELPAGRVILELAPDFAPQHVANVKALARERYYDGLAVVRAQDNYVVQWMDPNAGKPELERTIHHAHRTLPPEFDAPIKDGLPFTRLPDGDVYAREVGFVNGFPVARDRREGRMWLAHSYGMVGAGRDTAAESGGGAELYAVIGHAPRHLDRNVTLLGRVIHGMERLAILPRGNAPMGFYATAAEHVPIRSIRVAADVPAGERTTIEIMRTDTEAFQALVAARRNRTEEWFKHSAGRIDLSNIPVPVRMAPPAVTPR